MTIDSIVYVYVYYSIIMYMYSIMYTTWCDLITSPKSDKIIAITATNAIVAIFNEITAWNYAHSLCLLTFCVISFLYSGSATTVPLLGPRNFLSRVTAEESLIGTSTIRNSSQSSTLVLKSLFCELFLHPFLFHISVTVSIKLIA